MSSSSGSRYNHQSVMMIVMVVAVLLSVMSPGVPRTSAAVSGICNDELFPDGDVRILCVSALLYNLIGLDFPVKKGGWYRTEDCGDGTIMNGFRTVGEGASGCLYEAKDFIEYTNCHHRTGGQAWDTGCYMRFEEYEFYSGDL